MKLDDDEFANRLARLLGLPDKLRWFTLHCAVGEHPYVTCEFYTGEVKDDALVTEFSHLRLRVEPAWQPPPPPPPDTGGIRKR